MPRVLKDLKINEVSSVDVGAGLGVKVLIMKRDSGESEMTDAEIAALVKKSVDESMAASATVITKLQGDLDIAKREIAISKMSPAHKSYMEGCDEDTKKKFGDMDEKGRDDFMAKNPKKRAAEPVEQAQVVDLTKRLDETTAQNAELKKRLDAVDLEKAQASFKKRAADLGATDAEDGELMRKAYSGDVEAQGKWDARLAAVTKALKEQVKVGKLFNEFGSAQAITDGSALAEFNKKAEEFQKTDAGKDLSQQQAFAKVFENPANADLRQRYNQERHSPASGN